MTPDPPDMETEPWHGTTHGYSVRKCRGPRCRAAWSAYQLEGQQRRARDTPWEKIPHGTENGYNNYKCRCVPCTGAHSRRRAERLEERRAHEIAAAARRTRKQRGRAAADPGGGNGA